MKFKVHVEDLFFQVNVGQGYNDFAWLALVGAKLYSNQKNPNANYLPCFLEYKLLETDMFVPPHPRTKIYNLFKEPDAPIIKIQIRKGVVPLSYEQEIWYDQAYGKLRNIMKLDFSLIMQTSKIPVRQDPIYKVQIQYNMFNEIKYEFSASQYPAIQEIDLRNDDEQLGTFVNFRGSKELPLGSITYQFIAYVKSDKQEDDGQRQKVILDTRNIQASVLITPSNPISSADIQKKIKDNYKSPEQQLKQLDLLENKVEKEPTQLCPYNFKKIWTIIEKNADGILKLDNLEPNLIERVGDFLDNNLNKLYEVFYQYTQLYDQDMEKKDEIAITFQDIMHFLKFYGLVQDSSSLFEFVQFYDTKELRTGDIEDTLKATVKFAEFIVIIIKLAQYRKTINLVDVESQEHLIRQIVEKILYVNEMEDQFNEFQKHMKYNHVLTNYIRENQAKFQGTFISRLRVSSDQSYKIKCHIKREEIKQQIQDAGYKGDNLDGIMDQCYDELFQEEQRFQGFEGLFYYEYLQVMQWLAIRLVQNNDDQEENQNEEMPLEKMIERLDYLIEQIDI